MCSSDLPSRLRPGKRTPWTDPLSNWPAMQLTFPPYSVAVLVFMLLCSPASAESFLKERRSSLRTRHDSSDFQKELRTATGEALGCGGHVGNQQMNKIRESMQPVWNAIQKDGKGRIDKRSLRYVVYRHFHQKWSLMIKGFEPSRPTNLTGWGSSDDILSATVPGFVEGVLESRHAQEHGFDLQDAVYMVATIEEIGRASCRERV